MAIEASIKLGVEGLAESIASEIIKAEKDLTVHIRPEMDGTAMVRQAKKLAAQIKNEDIALRFEPDVGSLKNIRKLLASNMSSDGATVGKDFVDKFVSEIQAGIQSSFDRTGKGAQFTDIASRLLGIENVKKNNVSQVKGLIEQLKSRAGYDSGQGYFLMEFEPDKVIQQAEAVEMLALAVKQIENPNASKTLQGLKSSLSGIGKAVADFRKDVISESVSSWIDPTSFNFIDPNQILSDFDKQLEELRTGISQHMIRLFEGDFSAVSDKLTQVFERTGIAPEKLVKNWTKALEDVELQNTDYAKFEAMVDEYAEQAARLEGMFGGLGKLGLKDSLAEQLKTIVKEYREDNAIKWDSNVAKAQIDSFIPGIDGATEKIKKLRGLYDEMTSGAVKGISSRADKETRLDESYLTKLESIIHSVNDEGKLVRFDASFLTSDDSANIINKLAQAFIALQNDEDGALDKFERLKSTFETGGANLNSVFDETAIQNALTIYKQLAKAKAEGYVDAGGSGTGSGTGIFGIDEAKLERIIQLVETLVTEIGKMSGALGTIDEGSDIPNIITQFNDLVQGISPVVQEIQNVVQAVNGIQNSGFDRNGLLSGSEGAVQAQDKLQAELDETADKAKKTAEDVKNVSGKSGTDVNDISAQELAHAIDNVKTAVDNKTEAFLIEKETVDDVVNAEIERLDALKGKLGEVADNAKVGVEVTHTESKVEGGKKSSKATGKTANNKATESSIAKLNKDYTNFVDSLKSVDIAVGRTDEEIVGINQRIVDLGEAIKGVNTKTDLSEARAEFEALCKEIDVVAERQKQKVLTDYNLDIEKLMNTKVPESGLAEYNAILGQIAAKIKELEGYSFSKLASKEEQVNVQRLKAEINQLFKSIGDKENKNKFEFANPNEINKWRTTMADWRNKNTKISDGAKAELNSILEQMDAFQKAGSASRSEVGKCIDAFRELQASETDAGRVGLSFFDQLKQGVNGLAKYLATFVSFYRVIAMFREGISVVKEYNAGLREMRKVTSDSLSTLKKYQSETFKLANEAGVTSNTIQQSTADWLRLGESLEQASESAKQANILYNISEFENINDATKGLTSISQAYKDISKSDIVDKLVGVGDNFPIAVNNLAEGMQNVASVLSTQNVSYEQALALVTAANNTIQDASKASMGVRTMVLRMASTEEAKNELADLGEDVSDYVVQTKAKKRKIIKDYTSVKSNDFKGVDIIDANGNQRNPYETLLDIARIYKEIEEEDKKAGTNRAIALIEEVAGKQRSTVAASIFQNPEILEQAYEQALHSEGVAQKELEAQIDSIEGQMTQLKNSAEEFWTTFIDQDLIKEVIGLGKVFVDLGTSINKAYKSIPIIGTSTSGGVTGITGLLSAYLSLFKNFGGNKMLFLIVNTPKI